MLMNKETTNIEETKITNYDLLNAWWRWMRVVEVPVSFDRMQGIGFFYSVYKIIKKVYKDNPEEMHNVMKRHAQLFNSEAAWGSVIHGIVISLEEERADGNEEVTEEMIDSIKIGLMGPLAGIGDSVSQGIVMTISLAVFIPFAINGESYLAAFIPSIIYLVYTHAWSWYLFKTGYKTGRSSITNLLSSGRVSQIIDIASILGLFMIGGLSADYVNFQTALSFTSEAAGTVNIQEILDGVLPNMLPFILVLGIYYYILKNGNKYLRVVLFLMVLAVVLTVLRIM